MLQTFLGISPSYELPLQSEFRNEATLLFLVLPQGIFKNSADA